MDRSLFFEQYETSISTAKDVDSLCGGCPVQYECLNLGIATAGTGVFGGVYIMLGQMSKARNSHKSEERQDFDKQRVQAVKDNL